jgi:iron complex outermembrane receptor protein
MARISEGGRKVLLLLAGSALASGMGAPGFAQGSGSAAAQEQAADTASETPTRAILTGDAVGEIVVTSQRRAENLQDVPIPVTVFTADDLETRFIGNTLNLIDFTPNMFGSNNTGLGSANAYYIRGLGNTETIPTFDPPVGTYVDEIYLSRQNANNFGFFDVERVEVLRGPQGTLFGRNTTGGAVNVIMKEPGDSVAGFAELGYGAFDRWLLRGSIDLPVNEKFAFKFSGYWDNDDGYVENTTTGETLNDSDMWGFRGALRFNATERLMWNLSGTFMQNNGDNLLNFLCDPRNPADCSGRFSTTGMRTSGPPPGGYSVPISGEKATYGLGQETSQIIVASNIQWGGEAATLNLITGYVQVGQDYALDFADGRGLPNAQVPVPTVYGFTNGGFSIFQTAKYKQWSQEAKVTGTLFDGRLQYVGGLYFFSENNVTDFADVFTVVTGTPTGLPLLLADRTLTNTTNSQAVYFQGDFDITSTLSLTAGFRYTNEKKTFAVDDNRAICQVVPEPSTCLGANLVALNGVPIPTEQKTGKFNPNFVIQWQPRQELMVYASATNGFKSGGWNARGTTNFTLLPFEPETIWSYELGAKSQWFDNRLRANIAIFHLDTNDLQTPSAFVNPATGAITFITRNFADYQNTGVELELTAVPTEGLNLYFNMGYQDPKYKISDSLAPDEYGVKSVARQQLDCQAQLAAGRIPLGTGAGNAVDCAAGIVTATGGIALPVRTPNWSLAFGGTYDIRLDRPGIVLTPAVNVAFRSRGQVGTANASLFTGAIQAPNGLYPSNPFGGTFITGSESPSFILLSTGVSLQTLDGRWILGVSCENCLNDEMVQSTLANYTYYNPPRTWLLRARRNF